MANYRLTSISRVVDGHTVYRIEALSPNNATSTKIGEYGGWVESQYNLQQDGKCWITGDAIVYGNAVVKGNALVKDNAVVCGNTVIEDDSVIGGDTFINGDATIGGNVQILNRFPIGNAKCITNFMSIYNFEDNVTLSFFGDDNGKIFISDGEDTMSMKEFFDMIKRAYINPRSMETYRMLCSLVQLRFDSKKYERVMKEEIKQFC